MRKEAAISEWSLLYETAARIKELKPWEKFWDMDIVAVQDGKEEDTIFFSILGKGGDCYGVSVYEGYNGLNDFLLLTLGERMNLSMEYTMFSQKNLTCYWGNREELTEKQRGIIKELGYKYRGKNQWLYFMSYEPGYYPYNMDKDEVIRMTRHLESLEQALNLYNKEAPQVNFENGNMLLFKPDKEGNGGKLKEAPLPFTAYQFGNLIITDEELLDELKEAGRCGCILEADVAYLGASVTDKKYDRPANPRLCLLGEARSEMILKFEMVGPEEDVIAALAEEVIGFILQAGAPEEIRVSNVIVGAALEQICDTCGIKMRRVKSLKALNDFRSMMNGRFM